VGARVKIPKGYRDQRICFGDIEVDPRGHGLYRNGSKVKLQDQPFQILKLLLKKPGKIVTRVELRRQLWPADTFVDFEAGLNTAIRKLRNALGDDTRTPRFVETVPRHGYRLIMRAGKASKHRRGPIDSIAVLPLWNEGGNPEAEYISESITESLIRALSELPTVRKVIARNSVFRYKGRQIEPQAVGRELGVRALLMGRLLLRGGNLSISVELLDTKDSRYLWGEHYERKLAVIQSLQDEIAQEISLNLEPSLTRPDRKRRPRRQTQDPEAYQLYMRGRYCWNKRPAEGVVQKGISYFEQAIERDPKFVLPYVGLADSFNTLGAWESGAMAPNVAFPKAKLAAQKALDADDSLAEAHTSLAYASLHYDWHWHRAEAQFKQALKLNPKYSHLRHWYSHYLTAIGRQRESLAESLVLLELDPLDLIMNIHLAWHYQMARQYEQACEQANRTLQMEPNFHWGYFFLGLAHEQMGMPGEAIADFKKSVELSGGSTVMLSALGHAYAAGGESDRAVEVLQGLKQLSQSRYISSYEIALIYCALGKTDEALEQLEAAYRERSGWMPYLKVEPRADPLRADRRFQDLLQRVGFPA
jgi:TolB-like protein/Flp pilus assembly protein TadD